MKRLNATRQYQEYQLEKANEKEWQSEDLDRTINEKRSRLNKEKGNELLNAAVGWATEKSKVLKNEIEDLRCEISTYEETIKRLQDKIQTMQNDHSRELMQLETKHRAELDRRETEHAQKPPDSKIGLCGRIRLSAVSVSCCLKRATSSAKQ